MAYVMRVERATNRMVLLERHPEEVRQLLREARGCAFHYARVSAGEALDWVRRGGEHETGLRFDATLGCVVKDAWPLVRRPRGWETDLMEQKLSFAQQLAIYDGIVARLDTLGAPLAERADRTIDYLAGAAHALWATGFRAAPIEIAAVLVASRGYAHLLETRTLLAEAIQRGADATNTIEREQV